MKRIGEHAVVIGASMAGLLAARALADFYGTVTVLERDAFPVSDIPRKGVPQGRHAKWLRPAARLAISQGTSTGSAMASRSGARRVTSSGYSPRGRCWRAMCGAACWRFRM